MRGRERAQGERSLFYADEILRTGMTRRFRQLLPSEQRFVKGDELIRNAYNPRFSRHGNPFGIQRPHMAIDDVADGVVYLKIFLCVCVGRPCVPEAVQTMRSVILAVPVIKVKIVQHRAEQ